MDLEILGWPDSSFGFFFNISEKTRMTFWAKPTEPQNQYCAKILTMIPCYQIPSPINLIITS